MDFTGNNHHNPFVNVLLMAFSTTCYILSINAENFRAWTWWGIGMIVFAFALIRDFPKVKGVIKKYFESKKTNE